MVNKTTISNFFCLMVKDSITIMIQEEVKLHYAFQGSGQKPQKSPTVCKAYLYQRTAVQILSSFSSKAKHRISVRKTAILPNYRTLKLNIEELFCTFL